MGLEMRADWFVIQRWRTESNELAKTILCSLLSVMVFQDCLYDPLKSKDVPYFPFAPGKLGHASSPTLALLLHGSSPARTSSQIVEDLALLVGP